MMSKTLLVSMDGTRNDSEDEFTTNVYKLHQAAVNDDAQKTLYIPGVGNERDGGFISQALGGAFGMGADAKIADAVDWVNGQYQTGDTVIIQGFSRGSATARVAAGKIPHVTFLGCYDTVGAFGIPVGWFQKIDLFKDMHVGDHVKHALHLVALDETRPAFAPTLMNTREGIEEIWLPGAHSDIGGGVPHSGLSDVALEFMARTATKHGLRLREGFLDGLTPDLNGPIHYNTDNVLGADPRIACIQRDDNLTDIPALMHCTAIDRMGVGYWPLAWPAKAP